MSGMIPSGGSPFDGIRHVDENGNEYWMARELMTLLGYSKYERFEDAIQRAMISCQNAGNPCPEHFSPEAGSYRGRPKEDFKLSRYACYLIAQNGDPRKLEISAAQSYFAIKARERELDEQRALAVVEDDDGINELEALGQLIQGMITVKKEQRQLKQTLAEQEQQIEANRRLIESQETKLARIEGRVVEFDRIRSDAATALINLPTPTEAAPVETTDQKIRRMINDYCTATGAVQQDCYRNLYQQDYLRNRRRVTAHKQSRETHLQAYVRLGWVESLYSVAFSLFCAKTGDYSGDAS